MLSIIRLEDSKELSLLGAKTQL